MLTRSSATIKPCYGLVIFEQLECELRRLPADSQVQAIGLALDDSIAASIAMYIDHRDETFKTLEGSLRDQTEQQRAADRRKKRVPGDPGPRTAQLLR